MSRTSPRILVLSSTYPRWQGDDVPGFVHALCRDLVDQGCDITVLAPHVAGAARSEVIDGVTVRRYRYLPVRWQTLAYGGGILAGLRHAPWRLLQVPCLLLGLAFALWRELRTGRHDLVHAHWLIPQGLVAALILPLTPHPVPPLLCTAHGSDLHTLSGRLFGLLQRWIACRSAVVVVVSESLRKQALTQGISAGQLQVIPTGVDLTRVFIPQAGVHRQPTRLVCVGRLVPGKGQRVLVEALGILHRQGQEFSCELIGEGPDRAWLIHAIADLGLQHKVALPGALDHEQLPARYRAATIAVAPSTGHEGLGLSVIEAVGCGTAVVVSDIPAFREILGEEGGLLVEAGNSRALADALARLLSDPEACQRYATTGGVRVRDRYDRQAAATTYRQLIARLIQD